MWYVVIHWVCMFWHWNAVAVFSYQLFLFSCPLSFCSIVIFVRTAAAVLHIWAPVLSYVQWWQELISNFLHNDCIISSDSGNLAYISEAAGTVDQGDSRLHLRLCSLTSEGEQNILTATTSIRSFCIRVQYMFSFLYTLIEVNESYIFCSTVFSHCGKTIIDEIEMNDEIW